MPYLEEHCRAGPRATIVQPAVPGFPEVHFVLQQAAGARTMIVTIDGPAGSGKSTAARRLAERLGFHFLDTGAMYRVVGLCCLRRGVDPADESAVTRAAREIEITFSIDRVFADGADVTEAIRTPEVTRAASVVALNPGVRAAMVDAQRKIAQGLNIVTEGRDQGTIVFPGAGYKFFLTADPAERAGRRQREMSARGQQVTVDEILAQLRERDRRDENRAVAPLRAAQDAHVIDTSRMTADEVLALLERKVREKLAVAAPPHGGPPGTPESL